MLSCVNQVGVNLNTASKHLLRYVSGIGTTLADNIIKCRKEIGGFKEKKQLLKVSRLCDKVFEQCAGFLRIEDGNNPLDKTSVHPEAYQLVEEIAADNNVKVEELIGNEKLISAIKYKKYISEKSGEHTIKDVLNELKKPGIDPRSEAQLLEFANIYKTEDVQVGMVVPGVVTNITRFGAFIDIGIKQDGLVHVSEISHQYITDPGEVLKLHQQVLVKVLEVDIARKRVALSIKQTREVPARTAKPYAGNRKPRHQKKESDPDSMDDALSALKNKVKK